MDEMQENGPEKIVQKVVGWARLRVEREARGMSLAEVSAHLKLAPRQIEAIERGDLSALPGMAFAKGFVRNYARFLQLDPVSFVALIDADDSRAASTLSSDVYSSNLGRMPAPDGVRFSALPAALVVFVLAAVLVTGWFYHWFEPRDESVIVNGEQSTPQAAESAASSMSVPVAGGSVSAAQSQPLVAESSVAASAVLAVPAMPVMAPPLGHAGASAPLAQSVQSVPHAAQSAVARPVTASAPVVVQSASVHPAVSSPVPVKPAQSAPVASAAAGDALSRMIFSFEGVSWVEVHDASGKSVFSHLSQAGALQEVQGTPPFTLLIGNAPKVKLTWRGRPVDLTPYIKGDVARLTLQ
jgi:cytoskeleton protein RodZ